MATKIKHFGGIKKGQKFRVVYNSNSHNYPLNTTLKFREDCNVKKVNWDNCAMGSNRYNTLNCQDVELLGEDLASLELSYVELQESRDLWNENNKLEVKKYNEDVDERLLTIKKQIQFCKDLGITEYDDNVEKMYNIIQTINKKGDTSDIEKAKMISEMLF